jgi:pimeloyl-ACP methyl ester carboxylesterase
MQTQIRETKKRYVFKKVMISLISVCLLLLATGVIYEAISGYLGVKKYPPQGEMVNVGEYNLHVNKHGDGKPVIILEAGSMSSSTVWGDIPNQLANYGTVVTYDRGGYGWSEKAKTDRTGQNIVKELYTALNKAGIEGPYILVGHSLGGMYVRLFAQTYQDEVAGLLLLDSRPEDFSKEAKAIFLEAGIDPVLEGAPPEYVMSALKVTGIMRIMGQLNLLDFPSENKDQLINIEMRTKTFQVLHEEIKYMTQLENDIRQQSLGNLPLTIIAAGIPMDSTLLGMTKEQGDKLDNIWKRQQKQMMDLSSNSSFTIAEKSGHAIMIDEPELVIKEVKLMVEKTQGQVH